MFNLKMAIVATLSILLLVTPVQTRAYAANDDMRDPNIIYTDDEKATQRIESLMTQGLNSPESKRKGYKYASCSVWYDGSLAWTYHKTTASIAVEEYFQKINGEATIIFVVVAS